MLPVELVKLIAGGETVTVEFKGEERISLSDSDLVEAVVCLANGQGGYLLIGVEDDGRVTGARPRHGTATDPLRVYALIQNRTVPGLSPRVHLEEYDGKTILLIEVPRSDRPVGTSAGKFVRRAVGADGKPTCLPFFHHEMVSREATFGRLDYTALPVSGATWEDLDPLEFHRLKQMIRDRHGDETLLELSDLEIAKALGLVEANGEARHPMVAGLLLLGKEDALRQYLPTHEVAFQVIRRGKIEVNDFFHTPLVKISEMVYERFRARVQEQELMLGMLRVGIPDYAHSSFREAVHNALIHRDYSRLGTVHIQWYEDYIEISNPGGFVEGVRLDNLLTVPPIARNPRLADAFKRIGLVERTGRGIDTIFEGQLRNGRPAPDYSRSNDTAVVIVLPGGAASLEFARFVIEQEQAGRRLGLDDLLILNEIQHERRIDLARAMELTQKPTAPVRASLEYLVELGLIEARGEKKGRVYHFSPAVYRALGLSSAYVRTRGFEPIQVEAMVNQFVQAHGKITRADTAELCHLSESQAFRLLKGMSERGQLKRVGSGRGTYYEPVEKTRG